MMVGEERQPARNVCLWRRIYRPLRSAISAARVPFAGAGGAEEESVGGDHGGRTRSARAGPEACRRTSRDSSPALLWRTRPLWLLWTTTMCPLEGAEGRRAPSRANERGYGWNRQNKRTRRMRERDKRAGHFGCNAHDKRTNTLQTHTRPPLMPVRRGGQLRLPPLPGRRRSAAACAPPRRRPPRRGMRPPPSP